MIYSLVVIDSFCLLAIYACGDIMAIIMMGVWLIA